MSEQLRAVHLPSQRSDGVEQQVAGVVAALADCVDELVDALAEATIREGRQSGWAVVVPHDRRLRVHAGNDPRSILAATMVDTQFDVVPATRTDRARSKLAKLSLVVDGLAQIMQSFQIRMGAKGSRRAAHNPSSPPGSTVGHRKGPGNGEHDSHERRHLGPLRFSTKKSQ
jgi:hypothetical protein